MDFNSFALDPVAFSLGPLVVRWYALAYLAGFLLGWRYCVMLVRRNTDTRPSESDLDDFLTWAIIGVILGGRLGYVLFYQFEYYASDPLEALKLWRGGMSFHGGMLGVLIAMVLFARKHQIALLRLSDIVCAAAPIGLFFGRIANFINGELFGRTTDWPIGIIFPHGGGLPRHPSQLYEALSEGLILFVILYFVMKFETRKTGLVTGIFLLGYGTFRLIVEFFREPDVQLGLIGDFISMGQILCIPMIVAGIAIILLAEEGRFKHDTQKHR